MSVGAAAGFGMDPIEGCYIVALASVFALIPSGPGYAGTQDAAAITGILALGGTDSQALTYLILVRFVIAVPITAGPRADGRPLRRPAEPAPGTMRGRGLELLGYAVLVAAALAVRLIGLDDRPFHHDESQDAYFSWLFFTEGQYEYQPILHGPLRFYLTSAAYLVFGDSDFTARLAPALMGALMVPLPYLLRAQLGRVAAFSAAVALAFGPSYLYYSRFAREDIYIACITLLLLAVTFRMLERPRRYQPALIGALLALSFATKESTFITVFVAGTFFIAALALQVRRHGFRDAPLVRTVAAVGWEAWAWSLASFVLVFTVLFTVFLTNPGGLWDGIYEGLSYWLAQHGPGRGEKEWYFYIVVLFAEEWPALLLGAVGVVATVRRPTLLRAFLIWDFVLSLAVYSWANERFSWLVLHPLLPLLLLAGVGVQAIWDARGRRSGRLGSPSCSRARSTRATPPGGRTSRTAPTRASSSSPRSRRSRSRACGTRCSRSPRGPGAAGASRTSWSTPPRARRSPGRGTSATSAPATSTSRTPRSPPTRTSSCSPRATGSGCSATWPATRRRFPFRVWWVRDYGAMSVGGWWRWFTRREPWNETGGLPEWLYVRQGA